MEGARQKVKIGADRAIRPIIVGLWQMADQERDGKPFDLDRAAIALQEYARAGFDTFDMADHYGSAEIVAGLVHKAMRESGEEPPTILTKWCPAPGEMTMDVVRKGVETSLERLGLLSVDVMQFHWWRYEDPRYLPALEHLMSLRDEGLIGEIGLTNFDAAHLQMVIENGIEIASNQVCFSLIDQRAARALSDVARAHDVALLAFGTLCGGFLSDKWAGQEEPEAISDWSRMKYRRFIDVTGGWDRFQALMGVLHAIAARHEVSIANVATAWVMGHDAIRATIIGARLGEAEHRQDNLRALSLKLDSDDLARIREATGGLDPVPGDCGDEYRKPPFLTASGDLSHHLDSIPELMTVSHLEGHPNRTRAESGSIWEERAGFSRAMRIGSRIVVSGTTATSLEGDPVCPESAAGQTVFILDKIAAALEALGGHLEDVIRTRIYLRDIDAWEEVSKIHARYFETIRPANTLIGGVSLVGPYSVEIEAEAEIRRE